MDRRRAQVHQAAHSCRLCCPVRGRQCFEDQLAITSNRMDNRVAACKGPLERMLVKRIGHSAVEVKASEPRQARNTTNDWSYLCHFGQVQHLDSPTTDKSISAEHSKLHRPLRSSSPGP